LIAETDSILQTTLSALHGQFKTSANLEDDQRLGSHLMNIIGMLVVVPSNPEKYYFQMA